MPRRARNRQYYPLQVSTWFQDIVVAHSGPIRANAGVTLRLFPIGVQTGSAAECDGGDGGDSLELVPDDLVVARGDAVIVLGAAEHGLDALAVAVTCPVVPDRALAVGPALDDGGGTLRLLLRPQRVALISVARAIHRASVWRRISQRCFENPRHFATIEYKGEVVSTIRYSTFPRTEAPPGFTEAIVAAFKGREVTIATIDLEKGLTSDAILHILRPDLMALGFSVEQGKMISDKIKRPVFFGENGAATLQYEVDAFHSGWRCGLEIEAGRATEGNAIYRDLIQALVMVDLDWLVLAVPNGYRRKSLGRTVVSKDYARTCAVADALFGHSRIRMPYRLLVIGY